MVTIQSVSFTGFNRRQRSTDGGYDGEEKFDEDIKVVNGSDLVGIDDTLLKRDMSKGIIIYNNKTPLCV